MALNPSNAGQTEKNFVAIVNQGYFSDYFLAYRLDVGLAHLYERWDDCERQGDLTSRSRVRGLGRAFDALRVDAALTSPGAVDEARLDLKILPIEGITAQPARTSGQ